MVGTTGDLDSTTTVPAPRAAGAFVHRPWCLHADEPDIVADDATVDHHPDGDDCVGPAMAVPDERGGAVAAWLAGDELVVTGTGHYTRRADVAALILVLTERLELLA